MSLGTRVVLIQDFWRLLSPDTIKLQQVSKQIDLHIALSMLGNNGWITYDWGKVVVVGVHGVFVFVLDSIFDRLEQVDLASKDVSSRRLQATSLEHELPWPNLRLRKVQFGDPAVLNRDTLLCLKLTETKMYLSAPSVYLDERDVNMWCYDFAPSS